MSLQDEVIDLIAEQLGLDSSEISLNSSIVDDLGADSLDLTELVMALESRFSCEIKENESMKMRTVADVLAFVEKKQQELQAEEA